MSKTKFKKDNSNIEIRFINDDTDELLFTLHKNWNEFGELFSDYLGNQLITNHINEHKLNNVNNVLVLAVGYFEKV